MLKATKPVVAAPAAPQGGVAVAPLAPPVRDPEPMNNAGYDNVPVTQGTREVTTATPKGAVQNLNAGILDNIEDLGGSGNYVTIDGQTFLYKSTSTAVDYLDIILTYGKRFYQFVDESGANKVFHNSDTKLDARYKLKFEIRWLESASEEEEATEYTMTLSTTSAMNFISFLNKLAGMGTGINQVITRITTSRQVSRDGKNRYSRAEFEAFDSTTGDPLNVKTDPTK